MTDRSELLGDRDGLPDSHLFTVRLWPEALGPGSVEWRGKVTHVLSGEMRYFREWQTLLDFLTIRNGRDRDYFSKEMIAIKEWYLQPVDI